MVHNEGGHDVFRDTAPGKAFGPAQYPEDEDVHRKGPVDDMLGQPSWRET